MLLVRVPKADENMTGAVVVRWLAAAGERLARGRAVVELSTEKAAFELEAEGDGTLRATYAPERSTVPVGFVLAAIGEPGEPLPDVAAMNAKTLARAAEALGLIPAAPPSAPPASPERAPGRAETSSAPELRASPAARAAAAQAGVSLAEVSAGLPPGTLLREEHVRGFLARRGERAGPEGGRP